MNRCVYIKEGANVAVCSTLFNNIVLVVPLTVLLPPCFSAQISVFSAARGENQLLLTGHLLPCLLVHSTLRHRFYLIDSPSLCIA